MKTIEEFSNDLLANFHWDMLNPKEAKAKRDAEYKRKFTSTGIRTSYLLEEINKIVDEYKMVGYWQRVPHADESATKIAELVERLEKERLDG